MNIQVRWMGLRGQIDDKLLEKIRKVDDGGLESSFKCN